MGIMEFKMGACELTDVLREYEKFIEWDYEFIYTSRNEKYLVRLIPDMSHFYHLAGIQYYVTDENKPFKKETWLKLIRNGTICYDYIGKYCSKEMESHLKSRMDILLQLNGLISNPGISLKVVYPSTKDYRIDRLYNPYQILLFFEPDKIICLGNGVEVLEDEIHSWTSDPMRYIRRCPDFFLKSIRRGSRPRFKDIKLVYLVKVCKKTGNKEIILNKLSDFQGNPKDYSGQEIVEWYNSLLM